MIDSRYATLIEAYGAEMHWAGIYERAAQEARDHSMFRLTDEWQSLARHYEGLATLRRQSAERILARLIRPTAA